MQGVAKQVAVKIRLKRFGKIRAPFYRVVVADSRKKRDGRVIEEIGKYHPTEDPSVIDIDRERVQYWLGVGAQPTEPVLALLKVTGDWQLFKGLDGAEGTLKVKEVKDATEEQIQKAADEAERLKAQAAEEKAKEQAEDAKAEEESDEAEGSEEAEDSEAAESAE